MLITDSQNPIEFIIANQAVRFLVFQGAAGCGEQPYSEMVLSVEFNSSAEFEVKANKHKLIFIGHLPEASLQVRTNCHIKPIVIIFRTNRQTEVMPLKKRMFVCVIGAAMSCITGIIESKLIIQSDEQRPIVGETDFCIGTDGSNPMVNRDGSISSREPTPASTKVWDD